MLVVGVAEQAAISSFSLSLSLFSRVAAVGFRWLVFGEQQAELCLAPQDAPIAGTVVERLAESFPR